MERILDLIKQEEGWREEPYYCSEGYPTIGYGFKLSDKDAPLPKFTLKKGVGEAWLRAEVEPLIGELLRLGLLDNLNEARQAVLVSMAYQMGITGLCNFKNMLNALDERDYATAAYEMLDSRWAKQTPQRAERHSLQMKTGKFSAS